MPFGSRKVSARLPTEQIGITHTTFDGRLTPAFVIRPTRAANRVAFVICLGFVALGLALLASSAIEEQVLGLLAIAFFGFGALVLAPGALGRGPREQLLLTPAGVHTRGALGNVAFVQWDQIEELFVINIRGTNFVSGRVRDPKAIQTPRLGRWLMWLSRRMLRADISFSTSGLAMSAEMLVALLTYYVQFSEERDMIGTPAGLERLQAALQTVEQSY